MKFIPFLPLLSRSTCLAAVVLSIGTPLKAANVIWNVAGNGDWNTTASNWTGGSPDAGKYVNGDNATFNNTAGGTITIAAGTNPGSTTVSAASGTYSFTGSGIGTGALTKSNAGVLNLAVANSFSQVNLNAGTIGLQAAGALGSGNLHLGYGSAFTLQNLTGGAYTVANNITNATGSQIMTLSGGDFNFTGNIAFNNGQGQIKAESGVKAVFSGNLNSTGTRLTGAGGTVEFTGGGTGTITRLDGNSAALIVGMGRDFGTTITEFGGQNSLSLYAIAAPRTFSNPIALWGYGDNKLNFTGTQDMTFTGTITNTSGGTNHGFNMNVANDLKVEFTTAMPGNRGTTNNYYRKQGNGLLVFSGTNTNNFRTHIDAGVLRASAGAGLSTNSFVTLNGGVLEGNGTFSRTLAAAPAGSSDGASQFRWATGGGFSAHGGALTVNINGGGADSLTWASTANFLPNAQPLKLSSPWSNNVVTMIDHINLNGAVRTIHVDDNPTSTADGAVLSGNLTGTGGINKTGAGTLSLSGTNTYNGATNITQGKLFVNGSLGNTAITISPGAFLGGTGSIGSNLTIGNGAILAPGNSPGTLLGTTATWAGAGVYQWEINNALSAQGSDPGWDFLNLSGALTVTASSGTPFILQILGLDSLNAPGSVGNFDGTQSYSWNIATAGGGILGFNANAFQIDTTGFTNPLLGGQFSIGQAGNNVQLSFTPLVVIPEPSRAALLALFLSGLFLNRKRSRA
jgi:fibronectin-binding autotransporter adhesin